jgi:hypothetical protein
MVIMVIDGIEMGNSQRKKTPFGSCCSTHLMPRLMVSWIITKMTLPMCIQLFELFQRCPLKTTNLEYYSPHLIMLCYKRI